MVSGKPSNLKSFKNSKNFNFILILLCLTLVFLGKLDLIAIRNIKAFLSDFLEAEDTLSERLRFSLSARYECLCLQILDPDEEDLPDAEAIRFAEMEGDREVSSAPPAIREKYQSDMNAFIEDLQEKLASVSAEFESLRSDRDLGHALRSFLGLRNRKA